jgi:nicotinamidase-related amidase
MKSKNKNLHGSAPDKCNTALLLIDVINPLEFPEASQLAAFIPKMARKLQRLKERAQQAGVPVIYVNDNFGKWRSDVRHQVEYSLREGSRGKELVTLLRPDESDYFVLKPKHSGFFSTTLETLLRYLGVSRLVITGIAGNYCVLFTASDAFLRDYDLVIPPDCVISNSRSENRQALELMRKLLKADLHSSGRIVFPTVRRRAKSR